MTLAWRETEPREHGFEGEEADDKVQPEAEAPSEGNTANGGRDRPRRPPSGNTVQTGKTRCGDGRQAPSMSVEPEIRGGSLEEKLKKGQILAGLAGPGHSPRKRRI